nr:carboxypeptidase-like regulatory domain-containing protein [Methanothermus fervidus]
MKTISILLKNRHIVLLSLLIVVAMFFVGVVNATNMTNDSIRIPSQTNIDPTVNIYGTVYNGSSNYGLENCTIKIFDSGNNFITQTVTGPQGSYYVSFNSSETRFYVTALKPGYLSYTREINVTSNVTNPADPNLYGIANFRLYPLPAYSGNASSFLLNVGAIPNGFIKFTSSKIKCISKQPSTSLQ